MPANTPIYRPALPQLQAERPLTRAERCLLDACRTGEVLVLEETPPEAKQDDNEVRAELIRYLLLGGCEKGARPHPKGVQVMGAFVSGRLDFMGCRSDLALHCVCCRFENAPTFMDAEIGQVNLGGSALPGLDMQRARVTRSVMLRDGFAAQGEVNLRGARIGGQFSCTGGRFENKGGTALNASGAAVGAGVFLSDGFAAEGEVNLVGARIEGHLTCSGGRFVNARNLALNANAAVIGAGVFLSDGFAAEGGVNLVGARIGGQLSCRGGRFDNEGGVALQANAATVGADVFLRDGFTANGEVNLAGARISGQLSCMGGRFENDGGMALNLEAATVGADVFLESDRDKEGRPLPCAVTGDIDLVRADIAGNLRIKDVTITGKICAQRLQVGGTFF